MTAINISRVQITATLSANNEPEVSSRLSYRKSFREYFIVKCVLGCLGTCCPGWESRYNQEAIRERGWRDCSSIAEERLIRCYLLCCSCLCCDCCHKSNDQRNTSTTNGDSVSTASIKVTDDEKISDSEIRLS